MNKYNEFKKNLIKRFWEYQKTNFKNINEYFDGNLPTYSRPPVFNKKNRGFNVIFNPSAPKEKIDKLSNIIPIKERHRWFGSMNSSQALAQSVLGNLKLYGKLNYLCELSDDYKNPIIDEALANSKVFYMEHNINFLNEPRKTSLDGYFCDGKYKVAIECKFTEDGIGNCSRPELDPKKNKNYEKDYCNGTYTYQRNRNNRCSLSEKSILYWEYVPSLFKWKNNIDHNPCPLNSNYQLVRNVLAASYGDNSHVSPSNGHVVLIYDERNPAFKEKGNGYKSFNETRKALINPNQLRKISWQKIVGHLRNKHELSWLTDELNKKYGL